jgi:hypothetical protein
MAEPQLSADVSAPPLPDGAPRAGVVHFRHRHTDRYTVVGNHLAQHKRLSAAAIGLAVYIQSLPDGASVTAKVLTLRFREGEITIRRALNELESAGYLERRRVPLGSGRFATRTLSYDRPGHTPDTPQPPKPPKPLQPPQTLQSPQPIQSPQPPERQTLRQPEPRTQPLRQPQPAHSARPVAGVQLPAQAAPPPPHLPQSRLRAPAADLLARLRLADPRLLLSVRDVDRLVPEVLTWLGRAATPEQVTRALTTGLPPAAVPIHHPARFLEHRLVACLPPPLPAVPPSGSPSAPPFGSPVPGHPSEPSRPAPLVTCDGCERAFRTHDSEALCGDCASTAGPLPQKNSYNEESAQQRTKPRHG